MAPAQGRPGTECVHCVLPETTPVCSVGAGARHPRPSPSPAACPTLLRTATPPAAQAEPTGDPLRNRTCQAAGSCRYTPSFQSSPSRGPQNHDVCCRAPAPPSRSQVPFPSTPRLKRFDTVEWHVRAGDGLRTREETARTLQFHSLFYQEGKPRPREVTWPLQVLTTWYVLSRCLWHNGRNESDYETISKPHGLVQCGYGGQQGGVRGPLLSPIEAH